MSATTSTLRAALLLAGAIAASLVACSGVMIPHTNLSLPAAELPAESAVTPEATAGVAPRSGLARPAATTSAAASTAGERVFPADAGSASSLAPVAASASASPSPSASASAEGVAPRASAPTAIAPARVPAPSVKTTW